MASLWQKLLRKSTSGQQVSSKNQQRAFQPRLEQLEEKVLLSAYSPTHAIHPLMGPLASSTFNGYGLTPAQVRSAYGINGITFQSNGKTIAGDGSGQTIAIVDAYDDPSIAADLAMFDQQFGIAAAPSFTKVGISAARPGRVNTSGQTRSPSEPRAYSSSPSTVGVDREPGYCGPWLGPTLPRRVDQTALPSATARAGIP